MYAMIRPFLSPSLDTGFRRWYLCLHHPGLDGSCFVPTEALEKERKREKAQLRGELERVEFEMSGNRRILEQELYQLEQRKLNKAPLGNLALHLCDTHFSSLCS